MVINSTNINKTNNHLSSQIIVQKKDHDYDVGIPGPGFEQMAGLNRFMLSKWLFSFERQQDKKSLKTRKGYFQNHVSRIVIIRTKI
jgi:hypothetical protein